MVTVPCDAKTVTLILQSSKKYIRERLLALTSLTAIRAFAAVFSIISMGLFCTSAHGAELEIKNAIYDTYHNEDLRKIDKLADLDVVVINSLMVWDIQEGSRTKPSYIEKKLQSINPENPKHTIWSAINDVYHSRLQEAEVKFKSVIEKPADEKRKVFSSDAMHDCLFWRSVNLLRMHDFISAKAIFTAMAKIDGKPYSECVKQVNEEIKQGKIIDPKSSRGKTIISSQSEFREECILRMDPISRYNLYQDTTGLELSEIGLRIAANKYIDYLKKEKTEYNQRLAAGAKPNAKEQSEIDTRLRQARELIQSIDIDLNKREPFRQALARNIGKPQKVTP